MFTTMMSVMRWIMPTFRRLVCTCSGGGETGSSSMSAASAAACIARPKLSPSKKRRADGMVVARLVPTGCAPTLVRPASAPRPPRPSHEPEEPLPHTRCIQLHGTYHSPDASYRIVGVTSGKSKIYPRSQSKQTGPHETSAARLAKLRGPLSLSVTALRRTGLDARSRFTRSQRDLARHDEMPRSRARTDYRAISRDITRYHEISRDPMMARAGGRVRTPLELRAVLLLRVS